MSRISYLNGKFLPHENCLIHIEDRGFQFADGVYEVTLFHNNKLIDADNHIARLMRSLKELNINHNFQPQDLIQIQKDLFAKNNISDGISYIQITRGASAGRLQNCPKNLAPTIIITVSEFKLLSEETFLRGFKVMTHEDIRWQRCDIKTVNLLASTLVNQKSKDLGFDDAIFVRDKIVTEGTYSNVFMIDYNDNLITHPANNHILCGITRNRLIKIAQKNNIKVVEKNFTVDEMLQAKEVFFSSSILLIRPVSSINGVKIFKDEFLDRNSITKILRDEYLKFVTEENSIT